MKGSARNARETSAATPKSAAPQVVCDLCEWPFALPQHCIEQGAVLGLLVCSACCEDEAESRVFQ